MGGPSSASFAVFFYSNANVPSNILYSGFTVVRLVLFETQVHTKNKNYFMCLIKVNDTIVYSKEFTHLQIDNMVVRNAMLAKNMAFSFSIWCDFI